MGDYYERQKKIERCIIWSVLTVLGFLFLCKYINGAEIQSKDILGPFAPQITIQIGGSK